MAVFSAVSVGNKGLSNQLFFHHNMVVLQVFFFKDGEIKLIKYNVFHKKPSPQKNSTLVTMVYFCPNLQKHIPNILAREGCLCTYKLLRGLHELIHGSGLNAAWYRVRAQLTLLLLLLSFVIVSLLSG